MKLSTKSKSGKTVESIRVKTNDSDREHFNLTIRGQVKRFAVIKPSKVRLSGVVGEKISEFITVTPGTEETFEILDVSVMNGDDINYSMVKSEIEGKKGFLFVIENKKTTPGRYQDQVILITDKPEHNPVIIPILGNIRPADDAEEDKSP